MTTVLVVAAVAVVLAALWMLARRIRTWKEQILHAVAVLESNNAIAHRASRDEMQHNAGRTADILVDLGARVDALRERVEKLARGEDLRREVRAQAPVLSSGERIPPPLRHAEIAAFLDSLDLDGAAARTYVAIHRERMARTLDITPRPGSTGRALELGAYMLMTPALGCVLGYREVRGGYLGTPGPVVRKTASVGGREVFSCEIDLFNAEKDSFPYPDGHFDAVLICELLEHLIHDPMHMLLESARVLAPGGSVVLTTPNAASITSIERALNATANPQVYSHYARAATETPHIREYTPWELEDLLASAGYAVERLFTERIPSANPAEWVARLLHEFDLPAELRGEQIYAVARKLERAVVTRYPKFLYD